jgi:acyl carrier protein
VEDKEILDIVHQAAAEIMAVEDGEVAGPGAAVPAEGAGRFADQYGFSSIDALKFLLALEEKFGITLVDAALSEELLSSATALAKHIAALQRAQAS